MGKASNLVSSAHPPPQRALALDALRGFAILMMCLSGMLPKGLPLWMYHAQVPEHDYSLYNAATARPGITWVDLVFPMFLFAMGAAFPLALSGRIERGVPKWKVTLGVLLRGVSLVFFAVYLQNTVPYAWSWPEGNGKWFLALLAFAILFPIYMRFPSKWPKWMQWLIRSAGVIAAFGIMEFVRFPEGAHGTEWTVRRFDIIIMVLANMAVFGALLWLVTRGNRLLQLLSLAFVFAAIEAYKAGGSWMRDWLAAPESLSWMYDFTWLKYLFIVIPGAIIGEELRAWMKFRREASTEHVNNRRRLLWISLLSFLLVILMLTGLYGRWLGATTVVAVAGPLFLYIAFLRHAQTHDENFIRASILWGATWLMLGILFDPVEGGIKKDPSNMSYYFVTAGLSIFSLIALTIWIDLLGIKKSFGLFVFNGQNPMIAYAGLRTLLPPLVILTGIEPLMQKLLAGMPWPLFLWALAKTTLLAVLVAVFTKMRVYWRT